MTIAAYVLTLALAGFGLTAVFPSLIGSLATRFLGAIGIHAGLLAGALVSWGGLHLLWRWLEGGPIPLAALGLGFLAIGAHETVSRDELTDMARHMMGAEMWGIVIFAILLALAPGPVRWY